MNLISNTIMSKNINNPNEDSGKEFKKVVGDIMVEAGKPNLVDFFPMLKMVDPLRVKKKMSRHFEKVFEIFDGLIKERSRMTGLKHDDLLDVCLKITQENPHELNMAHIKSLFLDLFNAGTDTTTSTTEWAMTEMLRNPLIMLKAKEELEKVIGKGKIVNEDDVLRLPYLSCIVKETLRMHPAAPLLVPRKLETQVNLNGYTIPKSTRVLVNAWAIGRDPKSWEDPLDFKPERFLTSKIDVRGQDFELILFGAGRRICPGLSLAIRMIPMMLGSFVNNFDWKIGNGELDMAVKFGITLQKSVPLCVVPIALD